ncbi:FGGY family carbohydrate kinase [Devosia algicola]|uniref:FGGY family carbohydrate kinase n=1 Tax=Devosia algicola TaxID=3026418 RepID=A0ABY7YPY0_9HYPH|nr:FGGY family carbohydrate kinase [Devosia algicola]WDR03242.1 FGGY family carbohydrate kinase [Devosia algicola]
MAKNTLIGIDVGTTATKAVLIDQHGARLASFAYAHPTHHPQPGYAEQNPDDWMAGVLGALESFGQTHDLRGLGAIGICSQVNTHVFVASDGTPLMPAITWQDGRAARDAERLETQTNAEQKTVWFGAPMPIDASHALSRMAHVARTEPDLYARTAHVLLPKDYCVLQLTGTVQSDPISAVGLVNENGYVRDLLALVSGAAERLPSLADCTTVVGTVRTGLRCAGTPVVVGTMDAWGGMFGVGVVNNGDAMYQSGTSEIPGIVSSILVPTPGVITFPPYSGIVMHAAPTQSGGAALSWFARVLGRSPAEAAALAATARPGATVPMFLPHLQGERAPLWDSASRGVFARLDASAGGAEMALGVLQGVGYSVRLAFGALTTSAACDPPTINIGGGGALSDNWCQIRADILGKPLKRCASPEIAALGAAILAGLSQGIGSSLADAIGRLVHFDRTFEPDLSLTAYHADRFEHYQTLYRDLVDFNAHYQEAGKQS